MVSYRALVGIVAATLSGIAATSAHADLLPYVYQPLDASDLYLSTGWGGADGYVVGYGAGDATGGNYGALSWNLATGTRTNLDSSDMVRSNVFGASNGYAAGNVANNTIGEKAAVWDLSSGVRTILPTAANAFSYINAASGGVAGGYQTINGGYVAAAWDLASKSLISLDTTGFYNSYATGAIGSNVIGYGSYFTSDGVTMATTAYTWDKSTGVRTALDKTGFASTRVFGTGSGLILGDGSLVANGTGQALAWDTFSGKRITLDSSGLKGSTAYFAWNGVVFGQGTALNSNEGRPLAWDMNTGTRYDLASLLFPSGSQNVIVNGVDENTGTLTGSVNGNAYALTVIPNDGVSTIGKGQIANAPTTYEQQGGTNTVNGTFQFTNPADNNYRLTGGTLKGTGTIVGNLLNLGGTVAPGNSPGTLTITGDYAQTAGIYSVELASLSSFDQLAVSGTASLTGGELVITALTGYTPTVGDYFDIVTTGGGITIGDIVVPDGYTFTQVGNNGRLTFTGAVTVPEAGTGLLALLVAPGALVLLRRRK